MAIEKFVQTLLVFTFYNLVVAGKCGFFIFYLNTLLYIISDVLQDGVFKYSPPKKKELFFFVIILNCYESKFEFVKIL